MMLHRKRAKLSRKEKKPLKHGSLNQACSTYESIPYHHGMGTDSYVGTPIFRTCADPGSRNYSW